MRLCLAASARQVAAVKKLSPRKWCPRCERWRNRSGFYKSSRAHDGLAGWCRDCESAYAEARRQAARKPRLCLGDCGTDLAGEPGACKRCPPCAYLWSVAPLDEKARASAALYRATTEAKAYQARYQPRYRASQRGKEAHARYRASAKGKTAGARRQARYWEALRAAPGMWPTAEQREAVRMRCGGFCGIEGCFVAAIVEHRVQPSQGGSKGVENLWPVCLPHNSSKLNRPLASWLLAKGLRLRSSEAELAGLCAEGPKSES